MTTTDIYELGVEPDGWDYQTYHIAADSIPDAIHKIGLYFKENKLQSNAVFEPKWVKRVVKIDLVNDCCCQVIL